MELGKDFALRGCNRDRHTEDLSTNLLYQKNMNTVNDTHTVVIPLYYGNS